MSSQFAERAELWRWKASTRSRLVVDDVVDQVVLIAEVVVQLRLAGAGHLTDVVEAYGRTPRS